MTLQEPSPNLAWSLSRWTAAAYCCIGAALLLVLGMSVWGVMHDLSLVWTTLVQSETGRLRTHAARSVALLQNRLTEPLPAEELLDPKDNKNFEALRRHWEVTLPPDVSRLYSAVLSDDGRVIAHSVPTQEGKLRGEAWYDRLEEAGGDLVVETRNDALTGGRLALDVSIPIFSGEEEVGSYHSGLSYDWLMKRIREKQVQTWRRWGVILTLMMLVVTVAAISLFHITRRMTVIAEAVKLARVRRFAEMGQLMAGIVHEIRNPLNAMRLNLHVLRRFEESWTQRANADSVPDAAGDPAQIIAETNREIERVEGLMRILLGYARPDRPNPENIDLRQELEATLTFLAPSLERAEIAMRVHSPSTPAVTFLDRDRFRQIMLNLINNAKDAVGAGGVIEISLIRKAGTIELVVADDGPGVPPQNRERIFEPFFTTKEMGTGLGLPLVRRFIEEVGGTITCERNQPAGAVFRVSLVDSEASPRNIPESNVSAV